MRRRVLLRAAEVVLVAALVALPFLLGAGLYLAVALPLIALGVLLGYLDGRGSR